METRLKVQQSSFTLIALFSLEIGRCRGRNWLNGNQAQLQIDPDKYGLNQTPTKKVMLLCNKLF